MESDPTTRSAPGAPTPGAAPPPPAPSSPAPARPAPRRPRRSDRPPAARAGSAAGAAVARAAGTATVAAGAPPPRERFVLDSAHVGDIQGAFGTIREHEEAHRGWRSRGLALLAIIGPGLIVMVGDNDAGGVATYSQAGQNYGTSLLWVLLLLDPGAARQPGDGGAAGRGHRGRSRPAHQRALRSVLGLVLGDRPVPAELPHRRHRVHRRQPRARLLRGLSSTSRCRSRPWRWWRSRPPAASGRGSARCSCSCSRTCS